MELLKYSRMVAQVRNFFYPVHPLKRGIVNGKYRTRVAEIAAAIATHQKGQHGGMPVVTMDDIRRYAQRLNST